MLSLFFQIPHESNTGGLSNETMALGWGVVLVMELTVGILIPFVEEVIFRRFLFDWFQFYFPKWFCCKV